jgi:hypothetical protein
MPALPKPHLRRAVQVSPVVTSLEANLFFSMFGSDGVQTIQPPWLTKNQVLLVFCALLANNTRM